MLCWPWCDPGSSITYTPLSRHSEDNSSLFEGSSYTTGGSMTESMAELAAEDLITAMRTQRAQLLERRAEMQMRVMHLENEEAVSPENWINLIISSVGIRFRRTAAQLIVSTAHFCYHCLKLFWQHVLRRQSWQGSEYTRWLDWTGVGNTWTLASSSTTRPRASAPWFVGVFLLCEKFFVT